uniref:Uncharacterized protein n=1 Tax=Oryza sativa subsp. japonica TaxID=39947 RepID=Q67TN4_ORYSJ|nr:hypothetical protein [Oryza sativa Japonica Group]BAD38487.1 hypothetical protein [Oryza sativa Japonica Group]
MEAVHALPVAWHSHAHRSGSGGSPPHRSVVAALPLHRSGGGGRGRRAFTISAIVGLPLPHRSGNSGIHPHRSGDGGLLRW